MDRIQTFKTPSGDEMVVLSRDEYDRLKNGVEDEEDDVDEEDIREALEALHRLRNGTDTGIPIEVYKMNKMQGIPRIRAWRLYRKLSIVHLAKRVKKSPAYVTQIENGTRKGAVDTMAALAKALGTTIDGLRG